MKKFRLLAQLCLIFGVFGMYQVAWTQTSDSLNITIQVIDSTDQSPIALGALEVWSNTGERITVVQTDENGLCRFTVQAQKRYQIKMHYIGYDSLLYVLTPDANRNPVIALALKPASLQLKNVTVSAVRPVIRQEPGKLIMTVANTTLAEGSNMLEVLQKAPGVTTSMEGSLAFRGKQGLLVLIDNKNVYLSGEELAKYLETMSANEVEKIEIISNPSAKYDASGNIGIINIVTKKSREKRLNGSVQAIATYGNYFRPGATAQVNARPRPELGLYGSANYSGGQTCTVNNSFRNVGSSALDQNGSRISDKNDGRLKFGLDWEKGKHTVGVLLNSFLTDNSTTVKSLTDVYSAQLDSTITFLNEGASQWSNLAGNVNYILRIDTTGKLLEFNVDAAGFKYDSHEDMNSMFLDKNQNKLRADELFRNTSPSNVNIVAAKADYTHPIKPGNYFQTGIKFSRASTDNDLLFEVNNQGNWINDTRRSNHFLFEEEISAAYIDYYNRIGTSWDYGAGIRTEYSISKGNNLTIDTTFTRRISQFFPSGYIRKTFSTQYLMLTYGKRIERPDYNSLNPFVFYIDNFSFWRGNTALKPQLVHSLDLTYGLRQRWIASLYYTYTKDVSMQLPIQDDATKVVYNTSQNIGYSHYAGASISYYNGIKPWWYIATTLSGYYTDVTDTRPTTISALGARGAQVYFYTYNGFTLPKRFRLDVTLTASSANRSFWVTKGYAVMHLGLSKTFSKSTLTLNLNDVFNQTVYHARIDYQNLDIKSYYKPETRFVRLSYTYRFGNNQLKQQRERQTGVEDETKRVKN